MEIRQAKHEFHMVKNNYPAPPTDSKTRKDAYQTVSGRSSLSVIELSAITRQSTYDDRVFISL